MKLPWSGPEQYASTYRRYTCRCVCMFATKAFQWHELCQSAQGWLAKAPMPHNPQPNLVFRILRAKCIELSSNRMMRGANRNKKHTHSRTHTHRGDKKWGMHRFSAMGLNFQKLSTFVSIALLQRSLKNDFTRLPEKIQIFQFFHTVFFSTPVHVSGNRLAWRFDGRGVQAESGSNLNNPTTWGLSFLMPAGEFCSACLCVWGEVSEVQSIRAIFS